MDTKREETVEEITELLRQLSRALFYGSTPEWPGLELTMAQLKALVAVAKSEPTTVGTLAELLHIHLPAASSAADELVQIGLVRRFKLQRDRRRTYLELAPRGHQFVEQMRAGRFGMLRGWITGLAEDDLAALGRGVRALLAATATAGGPVSTSEGMLSAGRDNRDSPRLEEEDGCQ